MASAKDAAGRLRERMGLLSPSKLSAVLPAADVREALARLAELEAQVERLEFEAKQRLLFAPGELRDLLDGAPEPEHLTREIGEAS